MTNFSPFDAADYLDSDEAVAAYLSAALDDDDPDFFLTAVKDVARARGMTQLAKDAGPAGRACTRRYLRGPGHAMTQS